MKATPKGSSESSAADLQMSEQSANANSTSAINGINFPNKKAAKKVVPIPVGDEGSTATGRQLGRKLQTMFVFIVMLAILQVVSIVGVVIWMRPAATRHEQAQTDVQTPSTPPSARRETASAEAVQAAAESAEIKENLEELKERRAQEAQTVEKLKREQVELQQSINRKNRKLEGLKRELADAEDELAEVNVQIARANNTLSELNASIARAKSTRKKSQKPNLQVARKQAEAEQLKHKVRGLKGVATQKERRVKDLRMQIAGINKTDDGGKNRRTRRKSRSIAD
jgi:uncharacterized coiled-coil protein SlyX